MSHGHARRRTRRAGARNPRADQGALASPLPDSPAVETPLAGIEKTRRRWEIALAACALGTVVYLVGTAWTAYVPRNVVALGLVVAGLAGFAAALALGLPGYQGLPIEGPVISRMRLTMWGLLGGSLVLFLADHAAHQATTPNPQLAHVLYYAWPPPLAWYSVLSSRLLRPRLGARSRPAGSRR